jgi:hypothetical protein
LTVKGNNRVRANERDTMTKLHIAEGLSLPLEAVTNTFSILAIRGVGKTHTASVMAEEMLKAGQPICVYDPTGAWWGLKSSADGRHAGFPVVVFGGEHADVPLEESAGATVASVIVERRFPAILDTSLMRKGARIRFMTDFCETLYHKNREPLHFFCDEAHTLAPQNPRAQPEIARLLGAMEDIVLQGRRRGLGATFVSQRPALLNTNLRTQCETLICMRIVGPHDRKAIMEWVEVHGDQQQAREMLESLTSLPKGDGWVWSPGWLGVFKRVHFRQRETFDSSATPKVGQKLAAPKALAEIDIEALGEQVKAAVEKAKAEDPRALRQQLAVQAKRIAELEKQPPAAARPVEVQKRVEVPVLKEGQLKRAEKLAERFEAHGQKLLAEAAELRKTIAPATAPQPPVKVDRVSAFSNASKLAPVVKRSPPAARPALAGEGALTGPQQRILDELAELRALGIDPADKRQLGLMCGYTNVRSGGFTEPLGALLKAGLVVYPRAGEVQITAEGLALAKQVSTPATTGALQERILSKLDGPRAKILRELIGQFPNDVDKVELGQKLGYSNPRSGGFTEPLGSLRELGLIDYPNKGRVVALPVLFLRD